MLALLLRRLAVSIPLVLAVSLATFLLVSLSPTNVAYTILGARATPSQLAHLKATLGLDKPLIVQYGQWLWNAIHGSLGNSLITGQPVMTAVAERIGPTLSLILVTIVVTSLAGVGLGIAGALRGGWIARVVDALGLIGVAIPGFLIGLALIIAFAVDLRVLPSTGYNDLSQGVGAWASTLVLPVAALTIGSAGLVAKQVRASMIDALGSEFVLTFTANGFSRRSIVYKHALRNAAVPVLAVVGVTLVGMLSGSVLIEQVFGLPGIGGLALQATLQKDLPTVQGVAVIYTLIVVALNFLLDIAYAAVNPKVKIS